MDQLNTLTVLAGNFGISAAIALYMVYWVTKNLNGKLDKLIDKLEKLLIRQEELLKMIERR